MRTFGVSLYIKKSTYIFENAFQIPKTVFYIQRRLISFFLLVPVSIYILFNIFINIGCQANNCHTPFQNPIESPGSSASFLPLKFIFQVCSVPEPKISNNPSLFHSLNVFSLTSTLVSKNFNDF